MSDLHTALEAAITARLEVARAASPGPWHVNAEADEVLAVDDIVVCDGFALSGPQLRATTRHIALHDPDDAVRRYERDLKVLKRHAPIAAPHLGGVLICSYEWADGDGWDVLWAEHPPITDLLDVYPEVTR